MLRVRIIASKTCEKCKHYMHRLRKQGFGFEFYDGDADENQDQLDEWLVEDFPVVQIVEEVEGVDLVRYQCAPGTFSPRFLNRKIKEIQKEDTAETKTEKES